MKHSAFAQPSARVVLTTLIGIAPTLAVTRVDAQADSPSSSTVTVVPGARFNRGGLYRFFFGNRYRDLWGTPITVPKLDLTTFAGGLTATKAGGGLQTASLRLRGANGHEYVFRSLDKDASKELPPEYRQTIVGNLLNDQLSSIHPAGALVVPPILEAAGVLHATPSLVMMPDDPALGRHRALFGGRLGTIEERPREADEGDGASFGGAKEIVSSTALLKRLNANPRVPVDGAAFLAARLTDIFIGDWDRHEDQWRWALVAGADGDRWLPIPRDRDFAFARYDGLALGLIRRHLPKLINFGPDYPSVAGVTWNGRDLDRRLLSGLERAAWDSVAAALQSRLTDPVIDDAVSRLPPEFQRLDAARLAVALKRRRDKLPIVAGEFYRQLAQAVDVVASNRDDRVRVSRLTDDAVDVTVADAGRPEIPYYHRRFLAAETSSIRVYAGPGDDRVAVVGRGSGITVRVIGGAGDDRFADSASAGRTRFYDESGTNTSSGRAIDRKPFRLDSSTIGYLPIVESSSAWSPPIRDWGSVSFVDPLVSVAPDVGVLVGFRGVRTGYGFRKQPFANQLRFGMDLSTGASTGRGMIGLRLANENSRFFADLEARASGIDVLAWHGFGNETVEPATTPTSFYRVTQTLLAFEPKIGWRLARNSDFTIGPYVRYSSVDVDGGSNVPRFIGTDRPDGIGNLTTVGARASLVYDSRDAPGVPHRGLLMHLTGTYQPAWLDVADAYGSIEGDVATYLTAELPATPTLALHAGGKKLWGTAGRIPFFDAAFVGSSATVRGFSSNRFAGDASVFGSAELRLHLTSLSLILPGQQGVFGFYDVGRVYRDGEQSDRWHSGVGGGLWFSFVRRVASASVSVGHSDEGNRFYLGAGFAF